MNLPCNLPHSCSLNSTDNAIRFRNASLLHLIGNVGDLIFSPFNLVEFEWVMLKYPIG